MKTILSEIRAAVVSTLMLAAVCCGLYPLVVWGVAQVAFPRQANGSLIRAKDGAVRGSELLGQRFTARRYFHPRPSAAGSGYDAANSGGSNLGPTSRKLRDNIKERVAAYRALNGLQESDRIPADAVTASGSGLDAHISWHNAELQLSRIAQARGLDERTVRDLMVRNTDPASLGILGEPGVNVLKLNLALDSIE